MNDQQIFVLMAQTPNIRAVQIADALDGDLVDVSNALKPLVEVGDVVRTAGVSPNGHPAQVYNLSEQFRKSREYADVMAMVAAKGGAPVERSAMADAVNAPMPPASAAPAAPVIKRTKADLAVEFIRAQPDHRYSNEQLRVALGLKIGQQPSTWLGGAVKAGRLARDGMDWVLGATTAAQDGVTLVAISGSLPKDRTVIVVPAFLEKLVEAPAKAPTLRPRALAEPEPTESAPGYRCALWSDGQVEVQYDGLTVALMSRAGADALAGYLAQLVA